jgi:hypothetical protein
MIHDMVERLDHEGWVFAYIGANQDAMNEAYKLGIRNSLNFAADEEGTKRMWKKERSSRLHFLSDASKCDVFCESLKENYFSKSDAEDFEDWN